MMSVSLMVALALTARPVTVAVVDLETPDFMLGLAAQVVRSVVTEARAQKYEVISGEALLAKVDAKRYAELKKCSGKPACAAQILEAMGIERVVVGTLRRNEKSYLLQLWLMELKSLSVVSTVDRSILIASRRFQSDMEAAVGPFLRGEREPQGQLNIEINVAGAEITLNGEVVGKAPLQLTLKPGKYEVKVERSRYLPVTRLVAVEANASTKLELQMLLMPGQLPDDQLIPALTKKSLSNGTGSSSFSPGVASWILGGSAVAAGAVGVTFGLLARSQEQALRKGYDANLELYAGTRAQALEQNRNALIAHVSFGVAGAALVGTIISLILDAQHVPVAIAPGVNSLAVGGLW